MNKKQSMQHILQRAKASTPPFFKNIRNIGLAVSAVATALLTAPVTLPAALTTVAGYLLTAGTVTTAISQLTVNRESNTKRTKPRKKGGTHGSNREP